MDMGEYIKHLREGGNKFGIKWTQEELGNNLIPKVNRAAVSKWEKGHVENIKTSHIKQLAKMFGVTPCELMRFDNQFDSPKLAEMSSVYDQIKEVFGQEAVEMMTYFEQLNRTGKEKALEDLGDLVQLSKYTEKGESSVLKNA